MQRILRRSKYYGILALVPLICGVILVSQAWAPGPPPPPPPPPLGDQGCSPGFWKNHLDAWAPTGLDPTADFDSTFGVDLFDPDITLEQAVHAKGGGVNKLARHGTAALLNALHPDVDYPLTWEEVIVLVQSGLADSLADFNEYGSPLCD